MHDAVRISNNYIVDMLMVEDSELAHYPIEGGSPLYLAVMLKLDLIAIIRVVESFPTLEKMDIMPCMHNHSSIPRYTLIC